MRDIHQRCKQLIASLEGFAITHIRREFNNEANRLVSAAMQRAGTPTDADNEFLVLFGITPSEPLAAAELEN